MARVRKARQEDMGALVRLGALMAAESPRFARHRYLPERFQALLEQLMPLPGGCVLVAEHEGQIVGAFVGAAMPHFACDFTQASDIGLFVHPDHRGGTAAAKLVREYLVWAESLGAEPSIGINTGVNPERTAGLLAALGGEQSGTTWTWRN